MIKLTQSLGVSAFGITITLAGSPWWATFLLVVLALLLSFLLEWRKCTSNERIAKYKYRHKAIEPKKLE